MDIKIDCLNPVLLGFSPVESSLLERYPPYSVLIPCGECARCRASSVVQGRKAMPRLKRFRFLFTAASICYKSWHKFFITLTINQKYYNPSKHNEYLSNYVRRLKSTRIPFYYLGCLEAGRLNGREHYHLFFWIEKPTPELTAWKHGFVSIKEGYSDSVCGYISKYLTKSVLPDTECDASYFRRFVFQSQSTADLVRRVEPQIRECFRSTGMVGVHSLPSGKVIPLPRSFFGYLSNEMQIWIESRFASVKNRSTYNSKHVYEIPVKTRYHKKV